VCTETTTTTTTTTTTDACAGVACTGDACHADGTCLDGECVQGDAFSDGVSCDSGTPCRTSGVCLEGSCSATRAKPNGASCADVHCRTESGEGVCQDGNCGFIDFVGGNAAGWSPCDSTTTATSTATTTQTRYTICEKGTYQVFDCSWYRKAKTCKSEDPAFHCAWNSETSVCELKDEFAPNCGDFESRFDCVGDPALVRCALLCLSAINAVASVHIHLVGLVSSFLLESNLQFSDKNQSVLSPSNEGGSMH
jgi:hypothetical protein